MTGGRSGHTGVRETLLGLMERGRHRVGKLLFERRFDIETSGQISLEELGVAAENRVYYAPSQWLSLSTALRRREVSKDEVFIDIGSGMGRVVLQAARYPFRRVIGVEISDELTRIAWDNVERNRERLTCQDVELVTADALEYELPDDVTVVFLYNPVRGELFERLAGKLVTSVDRRPREIRVIYNNPTEHERLMSTGRVRVVKDAPGRIQRKLLQMAPLRVYLLS